jgi:hypothetical protein
MPAASIPVVADAQAERCADRPRRQSMAGHSDRRSGRMTGWRYRARTAQSVKKMLSQQPGRIYWLANANHQTRNAPPATQAYQANT